MLRTFIIALALAGLTGTLSAVTFTAPAVQAASVPDTKSCAHAYHASGSKTATQVGPKPIHLTAGSLTASDTNLFNAGCQPLSAPLPPQGAGKTFYP